jgi:surface carbohydrate biosynthesis protein (TIGR04326 family)
MNIDSKSDFIFWNKKDITNYNFSSISILDIVEHKSNEYRQKYLAWLAKISNQTVNGINLSDHFILNDNFNYWWLTSLMQKCNIENNSNINDAIKTIAIEDYISLNNYTSVEVYSDNQILIGVIEKFCFKKNLLFAIKNKPFLIANKRFKKSIIFNFSKSLAFLFFYFFKNLFKNKIIEKNNFNVTFIDIFVHLKKEAINSGHFYSNYWTSLVDKLKEWNIGTNWVHIFTPSPDFSKVRHAENLNQKFNSNSKKNQYHYILDQSLNLIQLNKILYNYFSLIHKSIKLRKHFNICPDNSSLFLWDFHKSNWDISISGPIAMESILRYELFDNYFKQINFQKIGFYIMENQPWEFILNYTWKKNLHGKLIGVAHSTIRFWDLRYYFDSSVYKNLYNNLFIPTLIAVNGDVAYNNLIQSGIPQKLIIKLEALRYLYLSNFTDNLLNNKFNKIVTVLICGDFSEETTNEMFKIINDSNKYLKNKVSYIFKPHPAFVHNFNKKDFTELNIVFSTDQIFNLIPKVDIVITSIMSSTSVDAFIMKKKLIQIDAGSNLNFSPLYNISGISVVSNSMDLTNEIINSSFENVNRIPYFIINSDLLLWKNILTNKN